MSENFVGEPGRVTKLEATRIPSGTPSRNSFKSAASLFKATRKLEQNRPKFRAQSQNNTLEDIQQFRTIPELRDVGDLLGRLQGKPKMFRSRAVPAPDRFVVRDSIESVIDFGG